MEPKQGPKGQKQGRKDFTKGPCLPKLDLFPPSFGQGPKGPKGRHFQKLPKARARFTPQAPKPVLDQVEGDRRNYSLLATIVSIYHMHDGWFMNYNSKDSDISTSTSDASSDKIRFDSDISSPPPKLRQL